MEEDEAHLFFGREKEVGKLAKRLRRHLIVAVVADSGAGKSSLVRAGLVPAFRGGVLEPDNWLQPEGVCRHVVIMRPRNNPLQVLRRGVDDAAKALGLLGDARASLRKRIDLKDADEAAYAVRCDLPAETKTLLVVDQFEELLTQTSAEDAKVFIDLLLALADPSARRDFHVVLTVRADYFNLIRGHEALFAQLRAEDGAAQYRLKRMSEAGIAQLVHEPLKMANYHDAADRDALVAVIQHDVSDRPGDLALIQMALYAAWRQSRRERSRISAAYGQVGGVLGAVAVEAERVQTDVLDEGERAWLLLLFARLIRLGDTGGAIGRQAALTELGPEWAALAQRLGSEEGGGC